MKTKLITVLAAAFIACGLSVTQAQTNTNQPPVPTSATSFAGSVQAYFTSFNTNLDSTFGLQRGEVAVGADSIQGAGVNLANSIRISYDAYKALSVEAVVRDSGISGILVSAQAGLAYNVIVHDAKLSLYVDGGSRQDEASDQKDKLYAEVGVRIQKALTEHTFAGVGMGVQMPGKVRTFSAFTGFTF